MFDNLKFATAYYAVTATSAVKHAAVNTKEFVVEHKSEITCAVVASSVVGVVARVDGFKAGYEFASSK